MNIDFALLLVGLTALTGAIWLLDHFVLAPKRRADKGDEADALWIRDYWLAVRAPQVEVA